MRAASADVPQRSSGIFGELRFRAASGDFDARPQRSLAPSTPFPPQAQQYNFSSRTAQPLPFVEDTLYYCFTSRHSLTTSIALDRLSAVRSAPAPAPCSLLPVRAQTSPSGPHKMTASPSLSIMSQTPFTLLNLQNFGHILLHPINFDTQLTTKRADSRSVSLSGTLIPLFFFFSNGDCATRE